MRNAAGYPSDMQRQDPFHRDWPIYLLAIIASLALSFWGAWAQRIPNPDGALYLRSAEYIASGDWQLAISTYRWPTYSAVIASLMKLTGLSAFDAAQLANGTFAVIATVAFVRLVSCLTNHDRLMVVCAAIIILLEPQLILLRPAIIRDNGFFACFLVALYFAAKDRSSPDYRTKLAVLLFICLAGLFRIEGFFLAPLAFAYFLLNEGRRAKVLIAVAGILAALLMLFGANMWYGARLDTWVAGRASGGMLLGHFNAFIDSIDLRLQVLRGLMPFPGGNQWGAYVGMVIGIAIVNIVRTITIAKTILLAFVFFPKRLMPRSTVIFIAVFGLGQLPVLLAFTFKEMLLDKRYVTALTLVLDIALVYLLAEAVRIWKARAPLRVYSPVIAGTLFVVAGFSVPRPTKLDYLKDAGRWIAQRTPAEARILTNDIRMAYYSGRKYKSEVIFVPDSRPLPAHLEQFSWFALRGNSNDGVPAVISAMPGVRLAETFIGNDGYSVFVLSRPELPGQR